MERYPSESSPDDYDKEYDDDTMPSNVARLADAVVGHRIVSAEMSKARDDRYSWKDPQDAFIITLDNGTQATLFNTCDCCAFTALETFLLHPERVDHMIMGVGTTEGFTRWHIYADLGDVLELTVGWSPGNPFYYGYGFDVLVQPVPAEVTA